jgi:hypothetical protein
MASRLFYRASEGASDQVTALFRFVWPTAAALWNLRWQVQGFVGVRSSAPAEELQHRFVLGSGLLGVDLKTACLEHTWEVRLPRFGGHPERDYSPRRSANAEEKVTPRVI